MPGTDFESWQEEQMQKLLTAESDVIFFDRLSGLASELGFEYCAYGMRMPLPLSNPKMVLLSNYSAAWQERYVSQNYLAQDPTVAHGLRSVLPLVWTDRLFAGCPQLWDDARDHGVRVGWAQSSYDAKGVGGLLTLARSGGPLSDLELRHNSWKMSWLAQVAHEGLSRLVSTRRGPEREISLTAREIEVLRWSADGKTSSEVGEIMSISERTVNFHVNNSLEKLGATNKTAGVIKAALLRLL